MKTEDRKKKLFLELFLIFLKIGAFTFGGGYAMIPLIQREVAEKKQWISERDIWMWWPSQRARRAPSQ